MADATDPVATDPMVDDAVVTVLVGGGKMGGALLLGWLAAGIPASSLAVVEADPGRRAWIAESAPGVGSWQGGGPHDAVLAVKPADVAGACTAMRANPPRRLLSIAAGVTTARLAELLPGTAVLRAMPNTPALVGAGAAGLAPGPGAADDDLAWAERLLGAVGLVHRVGEHQLDAVTGLSGSGPAYVFLVVEALTDAGVLVGLPRHTAADLAAATVLGAARMLAETGDDAVALRAAVTSPGGTTAAGLRALEAAGLRAALIDAVVAAAERSHQLGT